MALSRIGTSSVITSLDNNDKASVACNAAIYTNRNAVLEGWDWKSVSTRIQLTKDATPPAFGFKNRYLLPEKPYCLKVREMRPHRYDWVIEGRYLLTDADSDLESVFIRYTASTDDPSILTALCAKAIAWRMAAEICNKFVQGNAVTGQQSIQKEYLMIIEEAQGANQWEDKSHDEDSGYSGDGLFRGHGHGDDWVKSGTSRSTY
jgi:hypothetical protein